ncbi:hypothetical protein E4U43_003763 [Claviceps pusilla]|uniref:Ribosome biogenesis protein SLX9 n=1 Tax=Claviceps pusilla TaxID=123648 RepID=A0A9P7N4S3_9HYPO|nr:hypothetical protein E4U43_003763 [Claviceps pusilla]
MAPLPPSKSARALRSQRITGQIHPLLPSKIYRPDAHVTDDFLSTKRDKRLMKHSSFVSRISKPSKVTKSTAAATTSGGSARRRPKNKLKTSLEGLADALPEMQHGEGGQEILAGKIRHRSLASKKGALRRKERLVRGEMERFGASMAALATRMGAATTTGADSNHAAAAGSGDGTSSTEGQEKASDAQAASASAASGATANRWAALRGYISATMEQNPAFSST